MSLRRTYLLHIALAGAFLCGTTEASAGAQGDSTAYGTLIVRSDVDSAVVLLDGKPAGVTPLQLDSVAAGPHLVRVFHPDVANWLRGSVHDSIRVDPGAQLVRTYNVAGEIALSSTPAGAGIFLRDSLIGTTPLLIPRDSATLQSVLTITKEGYKTILLQPGDIRSGFLNLSLSPLLTGGSNNGQFSALSVNSGGRKAGLYLSGATAILAGIATAYLKIQSDDRQTRYMATGDPSLLVQRNRSDRDAAVSYVIMQIGFGIFAYLLLSD